MQTYETNNTNQSLENQHLHKNRYRYSELPVSLQLHYITDRNFQYTSTEPTITIETILINYREKNNKKHRQTTRHTGRYRYHLTTRNY